jgi:hypothetical protein
MMKKRILIALCLSLAGLCQAQVTPVIPTNTTVVESYDMPGYFLVCTTSQGPVQLVLDGGQTPQGQWNIVAGNTGTAGTVSFSPVALPNHFMRHRSYVFYCDPAATDNLYLNDSTFTPVPGLADPTAVSFRSVNYTTMYLMHNTNNPMGLVLQTPAAGNEGAATFRFPNLHKGNAASPTPEDEETDVYHAIYLSWKSGDYADKHMIFFGTDFNDVNEATISNPLGTSVSGELDVNNFNPGMLEYETTYYWRVDEINAPSSPGTYHGQVWTFTVEPYYYKIPADRITATAISSAKGNDPNNTINESGLDPNTDEHSNGSGSWASSGTDTNDVWIRYDFDKPYKLHEMLVWNYNHTLLWRYGFKDVLIEYSEDGQTWTQNTSVTQFDRASGKPDYVYNTVVPFNGAVAKSVRITALSNWGTYKNSGLSEVRFIYIPVRARYPKPEADSEEVSVNANLGWRPGREAVSHNVYISTSEEAIENGSAPVHTVTANSYVPSLDVGQTYYWRVDEANNAETPSLWQGDIWSFVSQEYITIDDFEDYNDSAGYEIWSTWVDGYGVDENGSQMGHTSSPFAEKSIVEHGKQSAPIYYDNTTARANYSEVTRTFASNMNWTSNGADTLRLYYRGDAVTYSQPTPGVVAMSAEGSDIYGTTDQFRFVYKQLNGNGSIIARVDSIERANAWSKAGVMIRNSLDPDSAHATAILAANNTAQFERRTTKGGTTTTTDVTNLDNPYWMKITRTGSTFTAERSADGDNWVSFEADPITASTATITMGNTVYIGLVVTSHQPDVLAAATFSGLETIGNVTGNWTVEAIGDTDQADGTNTIDMLYVSLEDSTGKSAKVFAPANAVGAGDWMEWKIPYDQFTGVNMTKIKKITIGVGDTPTPLKGSGVIYIDNIGYGHSMTE